jgi:hypothetical protein
LDYCGGLKFVELVGRSIKAGIKVENLFEDLGGY